MTVNTVDSIAEFVTNGVTTNFPFYFKFLANEDLVVTYISPLGNSTVLVLGTNYTVNGAGSDSGGSIVTTAALTGPGQLVVSREMIAFQQTSLRNQGKFLAETHEDVFDKLTMLIQQGLAIARRALMRPAGKDYYDAESRNISNLADPILPADAAPKSYVLQKVADALGGGGDGSGNSASVMYSPNGPGQIVRSVQSRLRDVFSVRDYIDTNIDGTTSNQTGIEAAVASALSAGAVLYWPPGMYVSSANIPNFHAIHHAGPGAVKRGSDIFYIGEAGATNRIYVAATGSDSNDGLDSLRPMAKIQTAVNAWKKFASLDNGYIIDLAQGVYDGAVVDSVISRRELVFEGKMSGSTKSVIIDGTSGATLHGLNFNSGVRARVKFIKAQNFSGTGACGITFQNGSYGVVDTCDASGNAFIGFSASQFSNLVVMGECNISMPAGGIGIRYYRQCTGSVSDNVNTVTCDGGGSANLCVGFQVRDNSYVVCNNGVSLIGCDTGLYIWKHSYVELRNAFVSNNNYGMTVDSSSIFANASGVVTYSGNTLNQRFRGFSFPLTDAIQQVWDAINQRFGFGGVLSPQVKYHLQGRNGASGSGVSSGYDIVLDNAGVSGIQVLTGGQNASLDFDGKSRISHVASDLSLRLTVNSVEAFRFKVGSFIPSTDNLKTLGEASQRWSVVYAGTGAINTSDELFKEQISEIDERVLRAWAKVEFLQYKFKDAVDSKGDGCARWHFGLVAQRVQEAFESEGLDAFDYGLLCYDEWPETPAIDEVKDEEGNVITSASPRVPGGGRYGIRYDEALVLECAYLRSKLRV